MSLDQSFEDLESDADTTEVYIFATRNTNRRIGMSDLSTVVANAEGLDEHDYDDDDYRDEQLDEELMEMDENMFNFIANSVFALSLLKETRTKYTCDTKDEPDCYICKNDF